MYILMSSLHEHAVGQNQKQVQQQKLLRISDSITEFIHYIQGRKINQRKNTTPNSDIFTYMECAACCVLMSPCTSLQS
jgi:23S rRNA maturation mini-RNase III